MKKGFLGIIILLVFVHNSSGETISSNEKMGRNYNLEGGDSLRISVEVSSGTLEVSVFDNENYNNFVGNKATYHKEWKRGIGSSKTFTFTVDDDDAGTWWVVFWTNSGASVTFTYTIDFNDVSIAVTSSRLTAIVSTIIMIIVIIILNGRKSKIPV